MFRRYLTFNLNIIIFHSIDIQSNITIVPEMIWSKDYDLKDSSYFPINQREERENSTKQQQGWRTKKANWIQFQKKHNNN